MAAKGALQVGQAIPITGTGAPQQILPTDGVLLGFFNTASGSITLNDANLNGNTAVSPPIAATQPSAANYLLPPTSVPFSYVTFPTVFNRGLVATIATGNVVVFFVA